MQLAGDLPDSGDPDVPEPPAFGPLPVVLPEACLPQGVDPLTVEPEPVPLPLFGIGDGLCRDDDRASHMAPPTTHGGSTREPHDEGNVDTAERDA